MTFNDTNFTWRVFHDSGRWQHFNPNEACETEEPGSLRLGPGWQGGGVYDGHDQ